VNIFKTALVGASLLVLGSAAASAADVYARGGSYKDEVAYAPAITWTGFYLGAHAGGSFDSTIDVSAGSNSGELDLDNGFVGGVHVGYNWQRANNVVLGLEASITGVDDETDDVNVTDYLATVRGRLGYAMDKTLVYATGGVAWLGYSDDTIFGELDDSFGWVAGAGIEHKLTNRISLGLEALYYDVNTDVGSVDVDQDLWTVQARLNFHLGSHDEPLK
jgi:outer membrane immunogenic protein